MSLDFKNGIIHALSIVNWADNGTMYHDIVNQTVGFDELINAAKKLGNKSDLEHLLKHKKELSGGQ